MVIYPDLRPDFFREHLIQFLAKKMHDFWNFVIESCILISDNEHITLKPQATKFKNKEVTAKHKSNTLEKKLFFPKALTLNPKHRIHPKP